MIALSPTVMGMAPSRMLPTPVHLAPVPVQLAFWALLRTSENVSSPSVTVSPLTGTFTNCWLIVPAAKVRVPLWGTKSCEAVAVPFAVL